MGISSSSVTIKSIIFSLFRNAPCKFESGTAGGRERSDRYWNGDSSRSYPYPKSNLRTTRDHCTSSIYTNCFCCPSTNRTASYMRGYKMDALLKLGPYCMCYVKLGEELHHSTSFAHTTCSSLILSIYAVMRTKY